MEVYMFLIQNQENNSQDMLKERKMENMTQRSIEKEFTDVTSIKL